MENQEKVLYELPFYKYIIIQTFSISKFIFTTILMIIFFIWSLEYNSVIAFLFSATLIILLISLYVKLNERNKLKKLADQILKSDNELLVVFKSNTKKSNFIVKKEDLIKFLENSFSFYCEKICIYDNNKHKNLNILIPTIH